MLRKELDKIFTYHIDAWLCSQSLRYDIAVVLHKNKQQPNSGNILRIGMQYTTVHHGTLRYSALWSKS